MFYKKKCVFIVIIFGYILYLIYPNIKCYYLNNYTQKEIEKKFLTNNKIELVEIISDMGNCQVTKSIPELVKQLDNKQVSHHIRFKGMLISEIAYKALEKIADSNSSRKLNQVR